MKKAIDHLVQKADDIILGRHSGIEDWRDAVELYVGAAQAGAAQAGSAPAFARLGKIYQEGNGPKINYEKSIAYLKKAVSMGCFEHYEYLLMAYVKLNEQQQVVRAFAHLLNHCKEPDVLRTCLKTVTKHRVQLPGDSRSRLISLGVDFDAVTAHPYILSFHRPQDLSMDKISTLSSRIQNRWQPIIDSLEECFRLSRNPENVVSYRQIYRDQLAQAKQLIRDGLTVDPVLDFAGALTLPGMGEGNSRESEWRMANMYYSFAHSISPEWSSLVYAEYLFDIQGPLFNPVKAADIIGDKENNQENFGLWFEDCLIMLENDLDPVPAFKIDHLMKYVIRAGNEKKAIDLVYALSNPTSQGYDIKKATATLFRHYASAPNDAILQFSSILDYTINEIFPLQIEFVNQNYITNLIELLQVAKAHNTGHSESIEEHIKSSVELMIDFKYWNNSHPLALQYGVYQ